MIPGAQIRRLPNARMVGLDLALVVAREVAPAVDNLELFTSIPILANA